MSKTPSFAEALHTCVELGVEAAGCVGIFRGTPQLIPYTRAEIDLVHPWLHPALRAIQQTRTYTMNGLLHVARLSLAHWSRPDALTVNVGETLVHIADIESMGPLDESARTVRLVTLSYDLVRLGNTAGSTDLFDIAIPARNKIFPVTFDWLEQHYPGSVQRARMATLLGFDADEIPAYALHQAPFPEICLVGLPAELY